MAKRPSRSSDPGKILARKTSPRSPQDEPRPNDTGRSPNYRNPSPDHRWKPGQSGNPKGRPKRAKGLKTILEEALARPAARTETGRAVSHREFIVRRLVSEAAHGNIKMVIPALEKMIAILGVEDEQDSRANLSANDMQILANFLGGDDHAASPDSHDVDGLVGEADTDPSPSQINADDRVGDGGNDEAC